MSINRVFLYAEIQVAVPFEKLDWRAINVTMKKEPGLKSKTWLSGINNHTIGGFYEFDSLENARHYAEVYLPQAAKQLGGSLSVKLFDGDVTEDASRGMASPHYAKRTARVPELAELLNPGLQRIGGRASGTPPFALRHAKCASI